MAHPPRPPSGRIRYWAVGGAALMLAAPLLAAATSAHGTAAHADGLDLADDGHTLYAVGLKAKSLYVYDTTGAGPGKPAARPGRPSRSPTPAPPAARTTGARTVWASTTVPCTSAAPVAPSRPRRTRTCARMC
ncbi:hypothetical protein ACFVYD_04190 [Streptomyces sp. NPDC058301]|uniref:hypothetical protein n=1 Tax=Streptomyces sp. NPDC058301 TaxID=3346436 RepID=UPI0036E656D1